MEADEDGALTIGAAMDRAQEYVEEVVVMGQMSGNLPISQPLTVGGSTVVGTPLTGSALTGGATGAHSASEALSAEDEREVDEMVAAEDGWDAQEISRGQDHAHSASEALSAEDEREVDESSKHFSSVPSSLSGTLSPSFDRMVVADEDGWDAQDAHSASEARYVEDERGADEMDEREVRTNAHENDFTGQRVRLGAARESARTPTGTESFPLAFVRKAETEQEKRTGGITKGYLLYTWREDLKQRKIPYWIVCDSMMKDPLLVEKVMQAMGLTEPNLILRFSRVKKPIHRWNNFWDFDKSGDSIVDDDELPDIKLPPGMTREKSKVARHLFSVAQDRVYNVLSGVSSACKQAGAWMELAPFNEGETPYGLDDHGGQLLGQASDNSNVIFATYSIAERRQAGNEKSTQFVNALADHAGDPSVTDDLCKGPKIFK